MEVLGQVGEQESEPVLLAIVEKSKSAALQNAALSALQRFPEKRVAEAVVDLYPRMRAAGQEVTQGRTVSVTLRWHVATCERDAPLAPRPSERSDASTRAAAGYDNRRPLAM